MLSSSHWVESGSRRSVKVRRAEFEPRRTCNCQNSMLTRSPLPTAAVRRVSHQASRVHQCTGSAATAQIRPSNRTARGVPAGVNRTSTSTSWVVSFATAVTVYALSQVSGHHFFPAGDRRTPYPRPAGQRPVFPCHSDGFGGPGVHLAVHQLSAVRKPDPRLHRDPGEPVFGREVLEVELFPSAQSGTPAAHTAPAACPLDPVPYHHFRIYIRIDTPRKSAIMPNCI